MIELEELEGIEKDTTFKKLLKASLKSGVTDLNYDEYMTSRNKRSKKKEESELTK